MNILVTGAKGFLGKNLIAELKNNQGHVVYEYDKDTGYDNLDRFCKTANFVYHFAGVNRPIDDSEFIEGNVNLTAKLLKCLENHKNKCPIMISSSIQANNKTSYGISKKIAEKILFEYGKKNNVRVFVYRLPNVFGKWSKPNYNSVISTFCFNISRNIPVTISDPNTVLELLYIDDLIENLLKLLETHNTENESIIKVSKTYKISLSKLEIIIKSFHKSRIDGFIPQISDELSFKLYSTYLSFLQPDNLSIKLKMNIDDRGSFSEFLKSHDAGQFSINVSKPGITKGNHWHHTKNEKFLVVYGKGVIRLRQIHSNEIIEYFVDSNNMEVIDIPSGYTHNITNLGDSDMITVMWANELYNPINSDTYYLEV